MAPKLIITKSECDPTGIYTHTTAVITDEDIDSSLRSIAMHNAFLKSSSNQNGQSIIAKKKRPLTANCQKYFSS